MYKSLVEELYICMLSFEGLKRTVYERIVQKRPCRSGGYESTVLKGMKNGNVGRLILFCKGGK